jgi:hypothetical protein
MELGFLVGGIVSTCHFLSLIQKSKELSQLGVGEVQRPHLQKQGLTCDVSLLASQRDKSPRVLHT